MISSLPNELLLKVFKSIRDQNNYKHLWKIRRTCKRWHELIPVAISDDLSNRFSLE
ncbi:23793_t:CDS:2, partial [Racocetra persica]